ncbi:acyl-CoA dehydrogenase family protein [Streptomyces sp. NPDC005811]|uniref:acyl-CoA dehydrogenase family protein n=1 Tax=Streptomyces sp. NPDC005811 TaxID=3154565 RepID=UPI0033FBADEA
MTVTEQPVQVDTNVIERLEALQPLLRERAVKVEEQARLDDEVLDALTEAGAFRLGTPKRFGGLEADIATQQRAFAAIARGCGSTGWVTSLYGFGSWATGLYDDRAQDEVFADGPDVRIAGIFSPTGTLTPVDGGYKLTGRWGFNTGRLHAAWDHLAAVVTKPDGEMEIRMVLVPTSELGLVEDWDTIGLRGTGSHTSTAEDVFVPEHRSIDLNAALRGDYRTETNKERALYSTGFFAHVLAISSGVPIGIAQAAMDHFLERLPGRGITYTAWKVQSEAPITHYAVADAQVRIESAGLLADQVANDVYGTASAGGSMDTRTRADVRARVGYLTELSREAVGILRKHSGASAVQKAVPIQQCFRDIEVLSTHAALAYATNSEVYGRVLVGIDPNTPFL